MVVTGVVKAWPDNFQYDGGDVLIRFSNHPSGILLLHSKVLRKHSLYFEAMLSTRWTQCDPDKGVKIVEVDLVFDQNEGSTYLMADVRMAIS
jgi:hypothetical protein